MNKKIISLDNLSDNLNIPPGTCFDSLGSFAPRAPDKIVSVDKKRNIFSEETSVNHDRSAITDKVRGKIIQK